MSVVDIKGIWANHGPNANSMSKFTLSQEKLLECIQYVINHPVETHAKSHYLSYHGMYHTNLGRVLTPEGFQYTRLIEVRINPTTGIILDAFPYLLGLQIEHS